MSNEKNIPLVIVPGAWQLTAAYDPIIPKFKERGFCCEVVQLPSVGGTTQPLPGLADDVAAVRAVLSRHVDAESDVLLMCHSYGGLVGSNAVEGFDKRSRSRAGKAGGISLIIYMSAFLVPLGRSLFDLLGGQAANWMDMQENTISVKSEHLIELGFNDLSPEMAAAAAKQMTHSSASVFMEHSTFEPWNMVNNIPCTYIFNTEDNAVPYSTQQDLASQLGPYAATVTLKASHCPFLSIPDQVVEAVMKLIPSEKSKEKSKEK